MTTDVAAKTDEDGEHLSSAPATRAQPPPLPVAVAAAAASGGAMLLAFPTYQLWWLAPVAVALLSVAVHRRRPRTGAWLGALAGLVFFVPLLSWTNLQIGNTPWLLLSTLQAGYIALLGAALAYLSPVVDRWRWAWPLITAVAWVGQEALRARTPFGGFPWGRLAFSQADSPLLPFAALGGAPLLSFLVGLTGGLLAVALWRPWRTRPLRHLAPAGALVAAAALVVLAGLAVPLRQPAGPAVTVAIVQGNVPRLGLDFNAQRRAVLDNHVTATISLADEVAAGRAPRPDLVIWPENSSDIDPLSNLDARARIDRATTAIDAPILVGALLRGPGQGEIRNAGLVWQPDAGPGEVYVKRHPVPFAEYIPLRPIVYPVAKMITTEVDRVAGFLPGAEPGVVTMGPATVGNVICFEVAYDTLVRDTVTGGGQLLAVQTNNATFNVAEAEQQLAMVRIRAVEHGRESLMASTVGVSGFVGVDGRVYDATEFFTQDVRVRTLTLTDVRTPATTVGFWPELVMAATAAGAVALAATMRRRARRPATEPAGEEPLDGQSVRR